MNLKPIEIVDDISPEDFKHHFLDIGKPLILKNYAAHWKALQKWTYDHLSEKYGDIKVKLYGKWLENEPTAIEMPPVKEVPFKDYIQQMKNNEESDLRIFLFNLFRNAPELRNDFTFNPVTTGYLEDFPYLFFGLAGSDVRLHYDIDLSNVFITQFWGTKRITLFDQSQSEFLYKLPFTTHSAADLNLLDYEKFPALKFAEGYQCDLKHGETLFMPSGIWHYIQYLDSSFSLSLRTLSPSIPGKIQGAYNVLVVRKLDEFLNKYYKRKWSDFKLRQAIHKADHLLEEIARERNRR